MLLCRRTQYFGQWYPHPKSFCRCCDNYSQQRRAMMQHRPTNVVYLADLRPPTPAADSPALALRRSLMLEFADVLAKSYLHSATGRPVDVMDLAERLADVVLPIYS